MSGSITAYWDTGREYLQQVGTKCKTVSQKFAYDFYLKQKVLDDTFQNQHSNHNEETARYIKKQSQVYVSRFYRLYKACRVYQKYISFNQIPLGGLLLFLGDKDSFFQITATNRTLMFCDQPVVKVARILTCLDDKNGEYNCPNREVTHLKINVQDKKTEFNNLLILASNGLGKNPAAVDDWFKKTNGFIREARNSGQAILIHCKGGKSRSVTLVIAYLMEEYGVTLGEALNYVRMFRVKATPNRGFMEGLAEYEQKLRTKKEGQSVT